MKNFKCNPRILIFFPFLFLVLEATQGHTQGRVKIASLPYDVGQRLVTKHAMVTSAHPLASDIGKKIMEEGGNAVDAAVATAFAIGVAAPSLSGIGGGGGMLIWLNNKKRAVYIDFYAAKRASTYESIGKDKTGHKLWEVGIPGEVAGLLYAEEKYGKLSRQQVMAPAIKLAKDGFPMYLRLAYLTETRKEILEQYQGGSLLRPNGKTFEIGKIFKQEALANTLQEISDKGTSVFYDGTITRDMVKILNEGGAPVTMRDFQDYKIKTDKAPIRTTYKGYIVLSAAPPQGGLEIIEDLNILGPYNLKGIGLPTRSARAFHILTGAMRAGMADRVYDEDPNWVKIPSDILISKRYTINRAKYALMRPAPFELKAGKISGFFDSQSPEGINTIMSKNKNGNTTSISVVDAEGNAVALTQTLSQVFGQNGAWVDGFFLNNSGVNFSNQLSNPLPNPKSKYRTRYSPIAPTIILNKDSTVKLVIGSPGGGRITTRIVQNIVYILDYGMDPMVAARMPHIYPLPSSNGVHIQNDFSPKMLQEERNNGYYFFINYGPPASIYSIVRRDGYWIGAAEPRDLGGVAGY